MNDSGRLEILASAVEQLAQVAMQLAEASNHPLKLELRGAANAAHKTAQAIREGYRCP